MPFKRATVDLIARKTCGQWVSRLMGFALAVAHPRAFFDFWRRLQNRVTNFLAL